MSWQTNNARLLARKQTVPEANGHDKCTHFRFGEQPRVEVAVLVDDLSALGEGELHDAAEYGALHVREALLGVFEQHVRGEPPRVRRHVPVPLRQPETQTELPSENMPVPLRQPETQSY